MHYQSVYFYVCLAFQVSAILSDRYLTLPKVYVKDQFQNLISSPLCNIEYLFVYLKTEPGSGFANIEHPT